MRPIEAHLLSNLRTKNLQNPSLYSQCLKCSESRIWLSEPNKWTNRHDVISLFITFCTLFQLRGGHFGPGLPKAVSHFHSFMTRVTKIHDFVHFSIPLVPVNLFFEKRIMKFQKIEKENILFWHQRVPPFLKKIQIYGFFFKNP